MTSWGLLAVGCWCAYCGERIEAGAKVLILDLPGVKRVRYYCEACAPRHPETPQDEAVA